MRNGILSTLIFLACSVPVWAQGTKEGTATGELIVGDKTLPLMHAYARQEDDVENDRLSGPQKSLTLIFTDAPLTADDLSDWFRLAALTRAGKVHAVQIRYDPAKKELFGASIFYLSTPQDSPINISLSGKELNHRLDDLKIDANTVSGTARMQEPAKWTEFGASEDTPPKTYTYNIQFSAPIQNPVPVSALLVGKAAQTSPQAAVARAFFTAFRAGDLATVRRIALPNPQMEEYIKKEGVASAQKMMRQMGPDPKQFAKEISKVIVRGDKCVLISGDRKSKNGDTRLKMVRRNGKWMVAQ